MGIIEDVILSFIYVISGTVYTITPQIARQYNVTGVPQWREHTFEHSFLLMAFEFLGEALCFLLWLIITGGVTPPRTAHVYGPPNIVEDRQQAAYDELGVDEDEPMLNPEQGNIQDGPEAVQDGPIQDGPIQDGHGQDGHNGDADIQEDNDELMIDVGDGDDDGDGEENAEDGGENNTRFARNPNWGQPPVDQTKFNPFLFVVPAFFDLGRYGLYYIAIKLAYNSSYMLSRCGAVLFTVFLRVAFLSKHMAKYMWVSIAMVFVGMGLFGMTDFVYKSPPGYDQYGLAAGSLLMVIAQILIAMQIVYEEKFMEKHSIHPLRMIGLEGIFGGIVACILLIPFSYIRAGPFSNLYQTHLVDVKDAFLQMKTNYILPLCVVGRIVSKTVNYYSGLRFVNNQRDAAKRITIDVHHNLIIWSISLGVGWQNFLWPQVIGYILVPIGMLIYCDVIPLPDLFYPDPIPPPEAGPLEPEHLQLNEQELDERNEGLEVEDNEDDDLLP